MIKSFVGSTLFALYMIISIIVFTLINLSLFFLPYRKRSYNLRLWSKSIIYSLKILCRIDIEFKGLENIPETPCIVFCKHQSTLETIALQLILTPQVWVLKRELLWIPFFGWSLALGKPIALDRSKGKQALKKLITLGKSRLDEKYWLIIFPEGTRTLPGAEVEYKIGGAMLANKTKVNILPIAHNSGLVWKKGQFIKSPGKVIFQIGPVIEVNNLSSKEILTKSHDWIEAQSMALLKH